MRNDGPSSNILMTQAVLFWIIAWWLAVLVDGEPMGTAVAAICATIAMFLAIGSATHAVMAPSPFSSTTGHFLWALRPRKWMIAWGLIFALVAVLGRPLFLYNYGGGRCQYIDWWLEPHWRSAHGDGRYDGCRFLSSR